MKWDEVEKYLRQYVGDICTIDDSNEVIYIGADLPDEYAHSNYTHILKGAKMPKQRPMLRRDCQSLLK